MSTIERCFHQLFPIVNNKVVEFGGGTYKPVPIKENCDCTYNSKENPRCIFYRKTKIIVLNVGDSRKSKP